MRELFAKVSADYRETAKYIVIASIIESYLNGDYKEAAQNVIDFEGSYWGSLPTDVRNGTERLLESLDIHVVRTGFLEEARIIDSIYEACIIGYFEENPEPGVYDFPVLNGWVEAKRTRVDDLQWALKMQDIDDARTINSHVTVTGGKLHANEFWIFADILRYIPSGFIAEEPEDIRYVLHMSDRTYTYYGTYDTGTRGYSTTVHITLTDTITGDVLFSRSYTENPPHQITTQGIPESVQANITFQAEAVAEDMKLLMSTLFPILNVE